MKNSTLSHYQHTLRAYVLATFGKRKIAAINREDIQNFLTEQARKYSESSLRSMRVVLALTLGWANDCGWFPKNPCTRIKLPKRTGGRKVVRTVLTPEQVKAIAEKLRTIRNAGAVPRGFGFADRRSGCAALVGF